MTNKAMREKMSSANSTDPNEQDQRICRARIISNAMEDEDPVDLLDTRQHEAMESTPAHSSSPLSPEETQAGNESIYSSVLRRFSLLGGSPKKSQVIPIEEHLEMTGKLEFDIEGLKRAHQNLETEFRNALVNNKRLAVECERAKEKNQTLKTVASNDTKILQDMVRVDRAAIDKLVRERNADHTQIANLRAELGATKERLHQAEYNRQRDIAHLSSTANSVSLELHAEREKARKETAQLHVQIKTINEMNDKFRQMLIPVSEKQVSDGDVAQKFTSLRSSILALVRRTWTLKLRGDVDIGLLPTGHRDFYRSRIPVSYDRLRYVVASFLYGGIFQAPNYFLRDDLQQFEAHIQMVERELFKLSPNENLKLAMDWRNASFKATEIFRGDISPFSSNLQRQIWKFFAPLKLVDATAEKAGRQKLKGICDSAAELHLMIRQLKDNFWVDNMQNAVDRPISEWGELAEEMAAVQVIDGKQPGTIAYVIAGALSKCPKENLSKVLVLEKAEVAVYRQETS